VEDELSEENPAMTNGEKETDRELSAVELSKDASDGAKPKKHTRLTKSTNDDIKLKQDAKPNVEDKKRQIKTMTEDTILKTKSEGVDMKNLNSEIIIKSSSLETVATESECLPQ
jgi:hypothetical protein